MATRTAQSGLWSDPATWGGTVPVNGDAFNIPVGVVVKCDVDQSSMATGMAASVIDGLLHFDADTNTCLKMNGNITGTGALYICERATITGFTLTEDKTYTYQVARSLDVATVEDTLGDGYLDAVEELVETAIDVENAARVAQGLNEMMPDAVQDLKESTKAALTLSQILTYVEATPASFYHDTVNDILYIHTSDSTDPSGKTITVIEPINRPAAGSEYRCYLLWNSTGTIAMTGTPIIRAYGWYPEREWTQLAADAASGQNQIVLEHDQGFQAGDIIGIASSDVYGSLSETNKGIYTISSYNVGTKTVTLTSNLQTNRLNKDYVLRISRPIKIARTTGSTVLLGVTTIPDNLRLVGTYFLTKFLVADSTAPKISSGHVLKHCSNNGNYIINGAVDVLIKDCAGSNYYISSYITNSKIKRCIQLNNYLVYGQGLSSYAYDCISVNSNSIGNGLIFKNCEFIKGQYMIDGTQRYINCIIDVNESSIPASYTKFQPNQSQYSNCVFKNNGKGYFKTSCGILHNCIFEGVWEIPVFMTPDPSSVWSFVESFDHNKVQGNYQARHKGGKIETDMDGSTILPGRLILTCESEDYPVFRDFQVLLPAHRTSTWQALTKKSFTGGVVKMELIDPANDPLIDPTAAPLATYTLPDQANTNLPLKLGYKSDKAMLAILRVTAQNSTGTVEIDTRLIENRIQHGQ